EVLGDGAGNVLTTTLEYLAPNKLHFKLNTGEESVAIEDTQYYLEPGKAWEKEQRSEAWRWPQFDFSSTLTHLTIEGEGVIDGERSTILATKIAGITYRFWIGQNTAWLRRRQMDGPGHQMLSTYRDFNAPIEIVAPPADRAG